jgi:sporulation protein YlmC with PRC-barrel domain
MLAALKNLFAYEIKARDPDLLGGLHDLSFDDLSWQVRHLIVDTTAWLARKLMLHPLAVRRLDPTSRLIELTVARAHVEQAPALDPDEPLSRARAEPYYRYFAWPPYWQPFGPGFARGPRLHPPSPDNPVERTAVGAAEDCDPHLRSARALIGCLVRARDEPVGQVDDVLVDVGTWEIKQLVVDTRSWWSGKNVLVSVSDAARVHWARRLIRLDLDPEGISRTPIQTPDPAPVVIAQTHAPRR